MSGWVFWLIGSLGLGGAITAGAIFVLGWPAVFAFSRTKVGMAVIGVATAGLGLLVLYKKALDHGVQIERERQEKANADALERHRQDVEAGHRLSDSDLDRQLRDNSIK